MNVAIFKIRAEKYEFQKNIKGSKLSILHNIGHVPMEETPTAFTEIVKGFIK